MLPHEEKLLEWIAKHVLIILERLDIEPDMTLMKECEILKDQLDQGLVVNEEIKAAKEAVGAKYAQQLADARANNDPELAKAILELQTEEAKQVAEDIKTAHETKLEETKNEILSK